jgi:putative membrane protein
MEEQMAANRGSEFSMDTGLNNDSIESENGGKELKENEDSEDNITNPNTSENQSEPELNNQIVNSSSSSNMLEDSKETIIMNASNFIAVLNHLYMEPEKYINREIIVYGFSYSLDNFSENEFVIARLYITCCAAHAVVVGLLCHTQGKAAIAVDNWYRVSGIFTVTEYENQVMPQINVTDIISIEKPENIYVY